MRSGALHVLGPSMALHTLLSVVIFGVNIGRYTRRVGRTTRTGQPRRAARYCTDAVWSYMKSALSSLVRLVTDSLALSLGLHVAYVAARANVTLRQP